MVRCAPHPDPRSGAEKRVYFAGPWVFHRDADTHADLIRIQAVTYGLEAILPTDAEPGASYPDTAADVAIHCLAQIRRANVIIADVSPFRGPEPDSGTIFEIGYAAALGHQVILFSTDQRSIRQRLVDADLLAPNSEEDSTRHRLEPFGLSVNAMLAPYPLFASLSDAMASCASAHRHHGP